MKAAIIDKVNMDLDMYQNYLDTKNHFIFTETEGYTNPETLMRALRKRNEQHKKDQHLRHAPLEPVPESFKIMTEEARREFQHNASRRQGQIFKDQLDREWSSELPWGKFTYANQEQFTDQHQEFLIHSMIGASFQGKKDISKSIKRNILNHLKGHRDSPTHSPQTKQSKIRIEKEEKSNQQKYYEFIERKVRSYDKNLSTIDQFQHLDGDIRYMWRILAEHFKSYDYAIQQNKPNPQLAIVNASITLIQAQFKQSLPNLNSQNQINKVINKYTEISKYANYEKNTDGILTWFVPYIYYRAGALANFNISLNTRGNTGIILREQFSKFQESLAAHQPTSQYFAESQTKDPFYNQLVTIVKGTNVYDERLSKIGSYDFVWFVLKTYKLFQNTNQVKRVYYNEALKALLQQFTLRKDKYSKSPSSLTPYLQFLYLGSYTSLLTYHKLSQKNSCPLTPHDYLHLLLTLHNRPQIMNESEYQNVREVLTKELAGYLSAMIQRKETKKYLIYYVLQIPVEEFGGVLAEVFGTWQLFSQLNHYFEDGLQGWKYIKFRYQYNSNDQIFQTSLLHLLTHLLTVQNFPQTKIKIILQAKDLLDSAQNYLSLLLEFQCTHLLNMEKFKKDKEVSYSIRNQEEIRKSNKFVYGKLNELLKELLETYQVNDYGDQDEEQQRERQSNDNPLQVYKGLFNFLRLYCQLDQISSSKNLQKQQSFLKTHKQLMISNLYSLAQQSNNKTKIMLRILQKFKAIDLFFIFIRNLMNLSQIISYNRATALSKIHDSKMQIVKMLQKVQKKGEFDVEGYRKYFNV